MTAIEWTHRPGTKGESWNLIGGCTKISPGCDNCYALRDSWRIQNNPKRPDRYEGVVTTSRVDEPFVVLGVPKWSGRINLDWDAIEAPYHWQKERTVFVCSMSDLFHEKVDEGFIYATFEAMASAPQHTYIVLTKRAKRMADLGPWLNKHFLLDESPNIWLGITAENQEMADLRIPYLLRTPAAVRWVSVEPMLGALDIPYYMERQTILGWPSSLDWVVIGAESGANRRPMRFHWAWDLLDQCDAAGIPTFVKQIALPDGRVSKNPDDWPEPLRRREWPR